MTVLKCKICGGDIQITGEAHGICQSCGCEVTLPKIDDDKRTEFYNRGNYFRQRGDFDRAYSAFEHIIADDMRDAEAHWSLTLCRYGVEYVQDPRSGEYMPTVSRMSYSPVLEDPDYLKALEYSDPYAQSLYRAAAQKIANIQEEYIQISRKEKPYDVFICFKAEEDNGQRTQGSIIAQDIYEELTESGVRTFFSRVTLRNIAGEKYEPYIFAALNSARVMLVVTSNPDHLEARWVKNEWTRFLNMKDKDAAKLLIPVCKSVSPYDLPQELQNCGQSVDASILGYKVDLKKRILERLGRSQPTAAPGGATDVRKATTQTLLKRALQTLEDGSFDEAKEFCGRALDLDPENGWAYYYLYLVEQRVSDASMLSDDLDSEKNRNFLRAKQYADETLKGVIESILTRRRQFVTYTRAGECAREGKYQRAIEYYESIHGYRDSDRQMKICRDKLAAQKEHDKAVAEFEAETGGKGSENYLYMRLKQSRDEELRVFEKLEAKEDKHLTMLDHAGWLYTVIAGIVALFFGICYTTGWIGTNEVATVIALVLAEVFLLYVLRLGALASLFLSEDAGCMSRIGMWLSLIGGIFFGLLNLGLVWDDPAVKYILLAVSAICAIICLVQIYLGIKDKLWENAAWDKVSYTNENLMPVVKETVEELLNKYESQLGKEELRERLKEMVDTYPDEHFRRVFLTVDIYPMLGIEEKT